MQPNASNALLQPLEVFVISISFSAMIYRVLRMRFRGWRIFRKFWAVYAAILAVGGLLCFLHRPGSEIGFLLVLGCSGIAAITLAFLFRDFGCRRDELLSFLSLILLIILVLCAWNTTEIGATIVVLLVSGSGFIALFSRPPLRHLASPTAAAQLNTVLREMEALTNQLGSAGRKPKNKKRDCRN